jgi:hypothetical protein
VDADGVVYGGTSLDEGRVGRVEANGSVYSGSYGCGRVGCVCGGDIFSCGAALLLLFHKCENVQLGVIYERPSWSPIGRVDVEGVVYECSSRSSIGKVDIAGFVYKGASKDPVGGIDREGIIYEGPDSLSPIGRVDREGNVYEASSGSPIGKVDGGNIMAGAAGLLLLLR